jgi:cytochrome c6
MKKVAKMLLPILAFAMMTATWSLADSGADTFKGKCAMCHGADGKGETAMGKHFGLKDLGSADVQKMSDAELTTIITKGKEKMPEYGTKLSKEQIEGVVKFIRTLKK